MSTYPRIVQDYVERRFAEFEKKRVRRFAKITDRPSMEAYVAACRKKIRVLYNLPRHKCDPRPRVTGTLQCEGYRIEKLVFQSRPKFLVTANLYIPEGDGPFPCVLGTCGHSNEGKAAAFYQTFAAGLALKGFMTLIYDPIGQGERWQYLDKKDVIPGCVAEHITIGSQQYLLGEYFGTWRAWDGIRALDVLLARPEADTSRVGVTGNSGGGTLTSILTALDDRFTMAAPSCYITTYRHNLENELPADTEQILPGIIKAGFEEYDHLTAAAPRPTIICSKEDDFFDQRGSQEAFRNLKHIYTLLGRPDDIAIATGRGGHGFDIDLREAMYAFFCKHAGIDDDGREPAVTTHTIEELNAVPSGQVVREGGKRAVDFTRRTLVHARQHRRAFKPAALRSLLGLEPLPDAPPAYRILRRRQGRSRIAVQTESAIQAVCAYPPIGESALFRIPPVKHAVLYLPHVKVEEDADLPLLKGYLDAKAPVFIVSTRGTGESVYGTCDGGDYFSMYDADFFYSSYCTMMGFPLAGRKVYDLLRTVQLLQANGYQSFELAGRGLGAVIALYSAPFIKGLKQLRIRNCIPGFDDMIMSDLHRWSHSVLVPGMLRHFDLPAIVEHVKQQGAAVDIAEPWDATMRPAGG